LITETLQTVKQITPVFLEVPLDEDQIVENVKLLAGRLLSSLSRSERFVLAYVQEKRRKLGVVVDIVDETDGSMLNNASSKEEVDRILMSAKSRVVVSAGLDGQLIGRPVVKVLSAEVSGDDVLLTLQCTVCKSPFQQRILNRSLLLMCGSFCRTKNAQLRAAMNRYDSRSEYICSSCGNAFLAYECQCKRADGAAFCPKCKRTKKDEQEALHERIYELRVGHKMSFAAIGKECGKSAQRANQIYHHVAQKKAKKASMRDNPRQEI
jgi:hypothetical protein